MSQNICITSRFSKASGSYIFVVDAQPQYGWGSSESLFAALQIAGIPDNLQQQIVEEVAKNNQIESYYEFNI